MIDKKAGEPYGGFILTFEPALCLKIDTALRYHRHEATETFSASHWKFLPRELVLVSLDMDESQERDHRTINGAALMERTKIGGATGKLKMRLHSPVMLDKPIQLTELPPAFGNRAPPPIAPLSISSVSRPRHGETCSTSSRR